MILTNIHNLPSGIFNAVVNTIQEPQPDVLRVTELINPVICKDLAVQNWETITADASEFLWSLLGTAVHGILANNENEILIEERVTTFVGDTKISGQVDRFDKTTNAIEDYKCTSVWSYLYGTKPEWIAQLNMYRFLLERVGFRAKTLTINAILRDWMMSKSVQADYPNIPFVSINIPIWSDEKIREYINMRIDIHNRDPLPCNVTERWQRPSTFAVMKEGRKSAVRVKDTQEEAQDYLDTEVKAVDQKKCQVVERIGEPLKCKSYCLVRDVCEYNFYKRSL